MNQLLPQCIPQIKVKLPMKARGLITYIQGTQLVRESCQGQYRRASSSTDLKLWNFIEAFLEVSNIFPYFFLLRRKLEASTLKYYTFRPILY